MLWHENIDGNNMVIWPSKQISFEWIKEQWKSSKNKEYRFPEKYYNEKQEEYSYCCGPLVTVICCN